MEMEIPDRNHQMMVLEQLRAINTMDRLANKYIAMAIRRLEIVIDQAETGE